MIKRFFICFVLLWSAATQAVAWTHGNGGGATPGITYNITTYTNCNGSGSDNAGFATWLSDALTWQSTHAGQLIQLTIPSGKVCRFSVGGLSPSIFAGLKNLRVFGYGAEINDAGGAGGFFLGGGIAAGQHGSGGTDFSVRLQTVSAGASSVTILDTAKCSLWTAGDYALAAGIDLQGEGFPSNPAIYEYVQIASMASCAGSGVITLTAALANGYKSTWPLYNNGGGAGGGNTDQGGPATLYALGQNWVTTQEYQGLTIDQVGNTFSIGQSITYRDVTMVGNFCAIPTQNGYWAVINGTMTNCQAEIDKVNGTVVFQNVTIRSIDFQSASVSNFTCASCTIATFLNGTAAKTTTISNSNIPSLQLGAHSFGASGAVTISNTVLPEILNGGATGDNVNLRGTWSGGQMAVPSNRTILGASSGTGGVIKLQVNSSTGYTAGMVTSATAAGCTNGQETHTISAVPDGTHIELAGTTFTSTCTGSMGSLPLNWAVPGANIMWHGRWAVQGPIVQVTDLSQDATFTYVQTSLNCSVVPCTNGLPTMPQAAGVNDVSVHPAPQFTCTNCTGSVDAIDLSNPGAAGRPLWSYSKRTLAPLSGSPGASITGSISGTVLTATSVSSGVLNVGQTLSDSGNNILGNTSITALGTGSGGTGTYSVNKSQAVSSEAITATAAVVPVFGALTTLNVTVSVASTAGGTMQTNIGGPFVQIFGSTSITTAWDPIVNAKVASGTPRVMTSTTTSGAQSGDTLAIPGATGWLVNNQITPKFSSAPAGGDPVSVIVEFTTNQGVVYPRRRRTDRRSGTYARRRGRFHSRYAAMRTGGFHARMRRPAEGCTQSVAGAVVV